VTGPSDTEYAVSLFVRTGKSVVWETNGNHSYWKLADLGNILQYDPADIKMQFWSSAHD